MFLFNICQIFLPSPAVIYLDGDLFECVTSNFPGRSFLSAGFLWRKKASDEECLNIYQKHLNIGQKCSNRNYCHTKGRQMITIISI